MIVIPVWTVSVMITIMIAMPITMAAAVPCEARGRKGYE